MRIVPLGGALVGALAVMFGCDNPSPPTAPAAAISADKVGGGCAKKADFIVADEASLLNALSAAKPGAVIALSGFFGVSSDVLIFTEGAKITCATPGAGLYVLPGGVVYDILNALSPNITVDHLRFDATQALDAAFFVYVDNVDYFGNNARFTNNTVSCPPASVGSECVNDAGGAGLVVTDNYFVADQPLVGIELQTSDEFDLIVPDHVRVERNTLIATSAGPAANFGAIRPYKVTNSVISNNVISGPWYSGISFRHGGNTVVEGNRITGALSYGVSMATTGDVERNDVFRENRISGSGVAGILVSRACGNLFDENNLRGNAGNVGLYFDVSSGANLVRGDDATGFLIVDNGAFDCDGNGTNDPNVIRADDRVTRGGLVASAAVRAPSANVVERSSPIAGKILRRVVK